MPLIKPDLSITAPARARPGVPWPAALAALLAFADAARLLYLKWLGLDPAVFEAETYTQAIHHALASGSLWPWDITGRFWPFLLMAPGIYLHTPLLAAAESGLAALWFQAAALALCAPLLAALAARRGATSGAGLALAAIWLLHPVVGVGFAWGWSPYATAAPLLLAALLLLERRRQRAGLALAGLAATMKVNVALMTGGLGLWARRRRWGLPLAAGSAAWVLLSGGLFIAASLETGNLSRDAHLAGPAEPTAGGLWTLAWTLAPLTPLLGRSGLRLVALSCGVELLYTAALSPANSGLLPACALLFAAASLEPGHLTRGRLALALALAIAGRQLYRPPRVSPLPLTPGAWSYRPDPRAPELRRWIAALPDDEPLLALEPASGAATSHPGPLLDAGDWDGRSPLWVVVPARHRAPWAGCTELLAPAWQDREALYAGRCGGG